MNADTSKTAIAAETWSQRAYQEWERFWFQPADPTLLGLIRIGCGLIALYAMFAFAFDMENFVGADGWLDLDTISRIVRDEPVIRYSLKGTDSPLAPPSTLQEKRYLDLYMTEFRDLPPGPYPQTDEEMQYCHEFRRSFGYDLRLFGLPSPADKEQRAFLEEFARSVFRPDLRGHIFFFNQPPPYFNQPPAPPYPTTAEDKQARISYAARYGVDPQRLLTKGQPAWSLFFHMTDPKEMHLFHTAVIFVTLLFTLGFCTRLTSVLTWFAYLNYVHRMPAMLFGVDVMTNIVMIYLMIGPSGAALSVDRRIARRWSRNKLAVINRWRSLWGKRHLSEQEILPSNYHTEPQPLVGANFAIRLLQVHLCIIYFVSGIAKLMGTSWWNGTAVWGTLANFEMAPMRFDLYNVLLRFLSHNELVFSMFLIFGTYFTLAFEIGYPFLIWRPRFRRLYLAGATLLHGMIGVVMGLSSFAVIMLVMNMAFLTTSEARRMVRLPERIWAWYGVHRSKPAQPAVLQNADAK